MIRNFLLKLLLKKQIKSGKIILCSRCLGDQEVRWQDVRAILDGIKKQKIKRLVCTECYKHLSMSKKKKNREKL